MADIKADVQCDFCGKWNNEVRAMIAGPGVAICSECIDLASEIIRERFAGDIEYESWGTVL